MYKICCTYILYLILCLTKQVPAAIGNPTPAVSCEEEPKYNYNSHIIIFDFYFFRVLNFVVQP